MPPEADTPLTTAPSWSRALASLPNRKFAVSSDLRQTLGLPDTPAVRAAHARFVYGYYARLARLRHRRSRAKLQDSFMVRGAAMLRRVRAEGRGAVLVSAHLGDFDLAGSWLAERAGLTTVAVVEPVSQPARQVFFDDVRRAAGLIMRRRHESSLAELEEDLGRGRLVLVMLDRVAPGVALERRLLGQPALLSLAPCSLVRRTGCPLLLGVTRNRHDGRRLLAVSEVAPGSCAGALDAMAAWIGAQVRAAPWQWHVPVNPGQLPFTHCQPCYATHRLVSGAESAPRCDQPAAVATSARVA